MKNILGKAMANTSYLWHFYETQKQYINNKSKKGMKENQTGFLLCIYLNVLANGTEEERNRETFKNLERFAQKHIDIIEVCDDSILYNFKSSQDDTKINISTAASDYNKFAIMPSMHINNTIIMLITRFEDFIADLIRYLYLKYPKKYLDDQTICFSEISQSNISEIKNKIVDREIDAVMRKDLDTWFNIFNDHKIGLTCCEEECKFLSELYATRNILVHNCGIVNEQYLHNVKFSKYKVGEKVTLNDEFIKKAFECIKSIMLCIMLEGIKLEKESKDELINTIFDYAFDELSFGNYNCSKTVFNAIYNSPFSNELNKQMSRVNCWLAKIELFGISVVETEIKNFDVTALDPIFLLAKNILLCQYVEATDVLIKLYENKRIESLELENWPLFKNYKHTNEFKKFKQSHPELASTAKLEISDEASISNSETTISIKAELSDISNS